MRQGSVLIQARTLKIKYASAEVIANFSSDFE